MIYIETYIKEIVCNSLANPKRVKVLNQGILPQFSTL